MNKDIPLVTLNPFNTTAEVLIPSTGNTFTVNNEQGKAQEVITREGLPYNFLKTEVGSGRYLFKAALN